MNFCGVFFRTGILNYPRSWKTKFLLPETQCFPKIQVTGLQAFLAVFGLFNNESSKPFTKIAKQLAITYYRGYLSKNKTKNHLATTSLKLQPQKIEIQFHQVQPTHELPWPFAYRARAFIRNHWYFSWHLKVFQCIESINVDVLWYMFLTGEICIALFAYKWLNWKCQCQFKMPIL